jgi:putative transferase (TIGR04331 family)
VVITASPYQYIKHGNKSVPLSAACLKPNALSRLQNTKEPFLFQEIVPINTSDFNKWSAESLRIVNIICNIYEELFNFNLDSNGRDIVFFNWISYLVFHFKSMNIEYQHLKTYDHLLSVALPKTKVIETPKSINDLRVMLQKDSFNEALLFYFISDKDFKTNEIISFLTSTAKKNNTRSLKTILKSYIKRFHLFCTKFSYRITPDNSLTSMFKDNIELMPDIDDFNFIYSDIDLEKRIKFFKLLSKNFKNRNIDSFNKLALFLSCYIPVTMFEDITRIEKLSKSFSFKKGSFFYSKTVHYNNELFKIKLANEMQSNNMKLVISCHGGGYHLPKWSDRDWEKRISNYMIPFSVTKNNLKNFERNRVIDRSLLSQKNNNEINSPIIFDEILIIGTSFEIYRTGVAPFPDQWQMCKKYADSILEIVAGLKNIYKKIYFRPHFNDYGWAISEYLSSNDDCINIIDPRKESLESNLKKFKLVINTADTTALIKCFHADILNIGLIDPEIYFDNNLHKVINNLYEKKVFFKNSTSLISFLEELSCSQLDIEEITSRNNAINDYLKFQQDQQIKNVIYQ